MNFSQFETEDRRLVLLKALENAVQYRTNAFLLQCFADKVGHVASLDQIRTDLAWLAEQGLISLQEVQGVTVATLTSRGLDVATGRAKVPGVAVPQPE